MIKLNSLKIKKLKPSAKLPTRATDGSAGYDLYACIDAPLIIEGGGNAVVPTGIAIELPDKNIAAMVYARSGLAIKHGLGLLNGVGVIDSDYRGEICVGLHNQFGESYEIAPFERIAQLILTPIIIPDIEEAVELVESERGQGGFGSTGKR